MYDYYEDDTPWLEAGIAPYIQQVILPKGLTSIGDYELVDFVQSIIVDLLIFFAILQSTIFSNK